MPTAIAPAATWTAACADDPALGASCTWITSRAAAIRSKLQEARPLDFGHWSAHKLEAMTDFELRHGEAVAIGVAIDTVYSSLVHGLPPADAQRVLDCLQRLGLPLHHPALDRTSTRCSPGWKSSGSISAAA